MGEIARRRRARDLWVSRSHLWALGTGGALLIVTAFSLGYALVPASAVQAPSMVSTGDESLVDLLARVDTRSVAQDGVDTLTFPDTLTGLAADPELPAAPAASVVVSRVEPGINGNRPFDLVIALSSPDEGSLLIGALGGRGWPVQLEEDERGARLVVPDVGTLDAARAEQARLAEDLTSLEQDRGVELRPR